MALKLANNAVTTLAGDVAAGSNAIPVVDASKFPTLAAGDWFPLTVVRPDGSMEVMRCTARAGTLFTVTRAQEGTAALALKAGDRVELRFTAAAALALPYLPLGGGTLTSSLYIANPTANSAIEIGEPSFVNTPFIDFHSSGKSTDYDVRLIASGGSATVGQGTLDVYAGGGVFLKGGGACVEGGKYYSSTLGNGSVQRVLGIETSSNFVDIVNAGGTQIRFINQAYNAVLGNFDNAGNFVAAGNISAYSDRTLKSNIKRIKGAMAKVRELVGVTFTRRRSKDKTRHMGFIAQDVEKVVPEVVRTDEKGVKMIAYPNLTALLAEALKEVDERVAALEAKQ